MSSLYYTKSPLWAPLHYYELNQATGISTILDSAAAVNGTVVGSLDSVPALISEVVNTHPNNALLFGGSELIRYSNNLGASLTAATAITVEFAINPTSLGHAYLFYIPLSATNALDFSTVTPMISIELESNGAITMKTATDAADLSILTSTELLVAGETSWVTVSVDFANDNQSITVGGISETVASSAYTFNAAQAPNLVSLDSNFEDAIGGHPELVSNAVSSFNGTLDEVYIYDSFLSEADAQDHYRLAMLFYADHTFTFYNLNTPQVIPWLPLVEINLAINLVASTKTFQHPYTIDAYDDISKFFKIKWVDDNNDSDITFSIRYRDGVDQIETTNAFKFLYDLSFFELKDRLFRLQYQDLQDLPARSRTYPFNFLNRSSYVQQKDHSFSLKYRSHTYVDVDSSFILGYSLRGISDGTRVADDPGSYSLVPSGSGVDFELTMTSADIDDGDYIAVIDSGSTYPSYFAPFSAIEPGVIPAAEEVYNANGIVITIEWITPTQQNVIFGIANVDTDSSLSISAYKVGAEDYTIMFNQWPNWASLMGSGNVEHESMVELDSGVFKILPLQGDRCCISQQAVTTAGLCSLPEYPDQPNRPPLALDDIASTLEDFEVDIDVLLNDTDLDGDTLTVVSVSNPANGIASINPNGTVKYIPNTNFNGVDSFTYQVTDGNNKTDSATVLVTVGPINDNPVANDDTSTTNEDVNIVINVLSNDTDLDLDTLTITGATNGLNGTTTINAGLTITYSPDPEWFGSDSFTYNISDGAGGTDTATVNVTVLSINDAPVANPDTESTDQDTSVDIVVLFNDTDLEGDTLSLVSSSNGTNGSTSIQAGDVIRYTPAPGFFGQDSFIYIVTDGNGGQDTGTVTVDVIQVASGGAKFMIMNAPYGYEGDRISHSLLLPTNWETTTNTGLYVSDPDLAGDDTFFSITAGELGASNAHSIGAAIRSQTFETEIWMTSATSPGDWVKMIDILDEDITYIPPLHNGMQQFWQPKHISPPRGTFDGAEPVGSIPNGSLLILPEVFQFGEFPAGFYVYSSTNGKYEEVDGTVPTTLGQTWPSFIGPDQGRFLGGGFGGGIDAYFLLFRGRNGNLRLIRSTANARNNTWILAPGDISGIDSYSDSNCVLAVSPTSIIIAAYNKLETYGAYSYEGVYGSFGTVLRSTDGGNTFVEVLDPINSYYSQASIAQDYVGKFFEPGMIYGHDGTAGRYVGFIADNANGNNRIHSIVSEDDGLTWSYHDIAKDTLDNGPQQFGFDGEEFFVVLGPSQASYGKVYRQIAYTSADGKTWKNPKPTPFPSVNGGHDLRRIVTDPLTRKFDASLPIIFRSDSGNGYYGSLGGGEWSTAYGQSAIYSNKGLSEIIFLDSMPGVVPSFYGLFKFDSGFTEAMKVGGNSQPLSALHNVGYADTRPMFYSFDGTRAIAGWKALTGIDLDLYITTDMTTWTLETHAIGVQFDGFAIDPNSGTTLHSIGDRIYRSIDSGSTWTEVLDISPRISHPGNPDSVTRIYFFELEDATRAFFTFGLEQQLPSTLDAKLYIYRSIDDGLTWTDYFVTNSRWNYHSRYPAGMSIDTTSLIAKIDSPEGGLFVRSINGTDWFPDLAYNGSDFTHSAAKAPMEVFAVGSRGGYEYIDSGRFLSGPSDITWTEEFDGSLVAPVITSIEGIGSSYTDHNTVVAIAKQGSNYVAITKNKNSATWSINIIPGVPLTMEFIKIYDNRLGIVAIFKSIGSAIAMTSEDGESWSQSDSTTVTDGTEMVWNRLTGLWESAALTVIYRGLSTFSYDGFGFEFTGHVQYFDFGNGFYAFMAPAKSISEPGRWHIMHGYNGATPGVHELIIDPEIVSIESMVQKREIATITFKMIDGSYTFIHSHNGLDWSSHVYPLSDQNKSMLHSFVETQRQISEVVPPAGYGEYGYGGGDRGYGEDPPPPIGG